MLLMLAGLAFQFLAVVCFALVLLHAFKRSVGTGVLVLCMPVYWPIYGLTQFEHRLKGLIVAGWLGGGVAALVLRVLAMVRT